MNRQHVDVYDTTLRDGTQMEGISLSCGDKLRIARRLDALGVRYIEGGFPGSNPKDAEFFERARQEEWANATIVAFGATRRAQVRPENDPSLTELLRAETRVVTLFGKSWTLHVTDVLQASLEENLAIIEESVRLLVSEGREVIYDAEHFFDGYKADAGYALSTLEAAVRGGAGTVALCDTNGGSLPWEVEESIHAVRAALSDVTVGIHAHDDGGLSVANTLAAVRAGARHVQGTINGYGERCGNANLCAVIPDIELKLRATCLPEGALRELTDVSHFVAEVANLSPDDQQPYVGRSAFAHKGGVHVSAMRRNADSYQHIDPKRVGNECRVVVSELSGRSNLFSKAEEMGFEVQAGAARDALSEIKSAEAQGYSFEAAEASVALIMKRKDPNYAPPFVLVDYKVLIGSTQGSAATAEAMIKLRIGDESVHTAAEGDGPVQALDAALRKALEPHFPGLSEIHLSDYKVRILDGRMATASTTRVLIRTRDSDGAWSTVGASSNIIEASCRALVDSFEFGLARRRVAFQTQQSGLSAAGVGK